MMNGFAGNFDLAAMAGFMAVAGCLIVNGRHFRGTTLVAPAAWAVFALTVLAGTSWLSWRFSSDPWSRGGDGLRLVAGVATFCPVMAVLGAKRPQHRGWQWIVLTLWIVLALPAAEAYFVRRGGTLRVHDARGWFLWILLLVSLANGITTRYWPSVWLCVSGQVLLLAPFLPLARRSLGGTLDLVAAALLIGVALLLPMLGLPRRVSSRHGLDQVWCDFRDSFGAIWALRIQEKFNAAASQHDWPLRLAWRGFVPLEDRELEADQWLTESGNRVGKMVRSLLRRFVSPEWIDHRLNPRDD